MARHKDQPERDSASKSGKIVKSSRTTKSSTARSAVSGRFAVQREARTAERALANKTHAGSALSATRGRTSRTGVKSPPSAGTGIEDAVTRYRALLQRADRAERTLLMAALEPDEADSPPAGDGLDDHLFGPAPTETELTAANLAQLTLTFERRREVAAASLTRDAVAELLGVTTQTVLDHLRSGALVGLRDGKRWLLPSWQFDADSERGFLAGIAAVSSRFPGGVVSLTQWVTRPSVEFGQRRPRDAMAAGRSADVADVASTLTAAGW